MSDTNDKPNEVSVQHGKRTTDSLWDTGRREIARTVVVPDDKDEYPVLQLMYELETHVDNRSQKRYTLYVYRQKSNDKRTRSQYDVREVTEDDGLLRVGNKELGQYCRDMGTGSPREHYRA